MSQCVHGDIRHLENRESQNTTGKRVHGDIRHLENKKTQQILGLEVHGDIRHLEIEQTISFDDEKKESVFLCEHAEAMRLCINLPPRVAKYDWQKNELWVDLTAFELSGNDGWNNITQSSILSKDARQ